MHDSPLIRLARPDEHDAVGEMVREAYAGDYELSEEYLAEIGDVSGRARESEVWIAESSDGRLLGTVTTPLPGRRLQDDTADGEMDLRLLGVVREARGRGVAGALMRHCFALASERGADRVVLHTASRIEAPQRLYERMGFARIPERESDFESMGETHRLLAYGLDLVDAPAPAAG